MTRLISLTLLFANAILPFPTHGFTTPRQHVSPRDVLQVQTKSSAPSLAFFAKDQTSSWPSIAPTKTRATKCRQIYLSTSTEEGDSKKDTPFIRPALHNSPFFRTLAILYTLLFAIFQTSKISPASPVATSASNVLQKLGKCFVLSPKAASTIHLLSFSTWFGTMAYTTFIAGFVMFKNLPRRVFGSLQSKLFPKYFQLSTFLIGIQILTLTAMPDVLSKASELSLGISLVATLLNLLYLEPTATRVMFDRYSLEDEEGGKKSDEYKKLAGQFGKFHGMSSMANLVAFCAAIVHGVRLSSGLVV